MLLGCALDAFDLAENLFDFSAYGYGLDKTTTRPVVAFVEELTKYGEALRDLREGEELCEEEEITRRWTGSRELVRRYSIRADDYNARLRDIIEVCEAAMPADCRERDGSLKRGACLEFTYTLACKRAELNDLALVMCNWRKEYKIRCAPHVNLMRNEQERIDKEDRRRDEAQMEEEESYSNDELGYRRTGR